MTKSKVMEAYDAYMRNNSKLKVGTYEANQLAEICGINTAVLVFLGATANAIKAPVSIKYGWYIYSMEERIVRDKTKYYITIDNTLKYL